MNYIELINNFWAIRRSNRITSLEADLYFFLIHESNMRNWQNPFYCSNGMICANIGISENSLVKARIKLSEIGLITFEGGEKKKLSPLYYLKICGKKLGIKGGITCGIKANINTVNKTKLNNTLLSKSIKGENPKIEKVKTEFETAFDDFLDMRKKIKKPATEKAKDLIFKKLEQFAPNNEIEQIKILEQSTLNCWQDVYELKNKNQNNDTRTNNGTNTKPELIGGIPKHEVEKLLSRFDRADPERSRN